MAYSIDIREVSRCSCRRVRRTARRLTQFYDQALQPSGLTANQFDLLSNLFGVSLTDQKNLPIGALAARMGMHPTTLTRDLRPLTAQKLVANAKFPSDRRIRAIYLTNRGREKLRRAVPYWRRAQMQVESALGAEAMFALNAMLDAAFVKLAG
jgi:DNA-binding MarR family transcriptional regulator